MDINKTIIMPKRIFDRIREAVNDCKAFNIPDITEITDPYVGQLARDGNTLVLYKHDFWYKVELPKWINPVGRCEFGKFVTYYIYWIRYEHPENYHGSYMLTTVPLVNMEEWIDHHPGNDDKIHDFICNFASSVVRSGGTVRFVQNETEAAMQACILSEQYKYNIIEAAVMQFRDINCEFIPEGEERNEN